MNIKIGVCRCLSGPEKAPHSFLSLNWDRVILVQIQAKRRMKAFPVFRHAKVLTTDAPYPHFDRSVVHLL